MGSNKGVLPVPLTVDPNGLSFPSDIRTTFPTGVPAFVVLTEFRTVILDKSIDLPVVLEINFAVVFVLSVRFSNTANMVTYKDIAIKYYFSVYLLFQHV